MEEHQERMGKNDNKEKNHHIPWYLVFNDIFLAEADIMTSKLREKKPHYLIQRKPSFCLAKNDCKKAPYKINNQWRENKIYEKNIMLKNFYGEYYE